MTDIDTLVVSVAPKIQAMIDASISNCGKNIKAVVAEILKMLLDLEIATVERISNDAVIIHPSNRFGAGVIPADMWVLWMQIIEDGFVWHEVDGKAICVRIAIGSMGDRQMAFNETQSLAGGTCTSKKTRCTGSDVDY